jgi:pyridoxamine 5'-phosphate oxidase
MTIADLRREYSLATLDVADVDRDPVVQFQRWFAQATAAELLEPNAMTLATCGADGRPSARIVLLKGVDARGFVFYTDYRSRKAADLVQNPRAALVFLWKEIERQVRIEGGVTRIETTESEAYFRTRPLGSRLSASASRQSAVIPDRASLDAAVQTVRARFPDGDVPLPDDWGGYRLAPSLLEFWQGRPDRLHDRIRYRRDGGAWLVERLSP